MFTSLCLWQQKRVNISEYMLLLRRLDSRAGDTTRRIWCLPRALSPGGLWRRKGPGEDRRGEVL
jgi:hypothetical protein